MNNAFEDKMVSSQNEMNVAKSISQLCNNALLAYTTTVKVPQESLFVHFLINRF
jgi:hypothetical protein